MNISELSNEQLESLLITGDGKGQKVKGEALAELRARDSANLFTVEEIAQYIAGWSMGSFEEVAKIGAAVLSNARTQLECDQDGIAAQKKRQLLK